ncbi:MAG: gliding motility-associated C-terminal domain-containing protein [Saprospiraceae bacterium]|nr:gliding motility-associated C-terminal domain-containing protein [Saprospiraceae bacterium]
MTNRLRMASWAMLGFITALTWIALPGHVAAQQGFFNFNYPGPDTIIIKPATCSNILSGNIGTPIVTSPFGYTITQSAFDPVASGFQLTDPWSYNNVAKVVWQVADNQGHTALFEFFINFVDTTKPVVVTAGTPPTVTYASIKQVPPPPVLTATDSCGNPVVTFSQTTPPPLCAGGVFVRTWLATDDSGNTGVFNQTITILVDTLPPTVTTPPQNGSSSCTQTETAYPAWLAAQMTAFKATDPSGVASYTNNAPPALSGSCPPPVTVTFTATDSCGFAVTRTASFASVDTTGPYILRAPQDSVAACSPPNDNHLAALADWIHRRAGLVTADSCTPPSELVYTMQIGGVNRDSAEVTAAFLASLANGCGPQTFGNQNYPKVRGMVAVDFFVRDACNNTTPLGTAKFGAIDTVPPVISGMMFTEECGGGNDSTVLVNWINAHANATVTDDCSAYTWTNFSWTTSTGQTGTGTFGTGPYPAIVAHDCNWHADVTFRATDECGNVGSSIIRFRIRDTTKPVFSAIPTDTIFCPVVTPDMPVSFVTDNCDSAVTLTYTFVPTNQICPGSYTLLVTWLATDDCGNTATAPQTVVVRDTTKPFITLSPANVTMRCDTFALPPAPVLGQHVTAVDNCGMVVGLTFSDASTQNPNPATCGHYAYTITRTFVVSDDCGNTTTTQQVITVVENIPPAITGFLDTTLVCEVLPITPPPTAADVCTGIASAPTLISEIIDNPGCGDTYTKILTWQSTDVCGNTRQFSQNVHVVDTVKPVLVGVPGDVTVECNQVPPPPAPGAVSGTDNCDETVDITFVQTLLQDPNPANCAHWANYQVRREWTVVDNCSNSRTYTQTITVLDRTGPEVVALDTVHVPTAPGLCGANVQVPVLLSVFDDCTAQSGPVTLRDTVVLTASGVPVDLVPVNPVVFSWASPNMPPNTPVLGNATLTIYLDNADSELLSETFQVLGEGGYLIGRTKQTNVSCGFSDTTFTLPAALLNTWLADGQLNITLTPNGIGAEACNAFCPGEDRARATLSYNVATPQIPVTITCSVDGGPELAYPPASSFFLDTGNHAVVYEAMDCAGNTTTATTVVHVADMEPPVVTAPANITTHVGALNCLVSITLPFPALQENCAFSANLSKTSGVAPVQFESDPNAGWVPKNTILNIPGLLPNAVSGGTLTIRHKGDNGNPGEFFRVLDEQGGFLDTTDISTSGQCTDVHETTIPVSAAQINTWAANGAAGFLLQANRNVVNFTDFINPCGPLNAGNFDGISTMEAVLTYNYAVVEYEVRKGVQLVQSGQLNGGQTSISLPPGAYVVQYKTTDNSGNTGTATFSITVRDTVPPVAKCQPTTIFTNPHGSVNYVLTPQEVNNGSMDNCSGTNLSFALSQTAFTCNMAAPPNNIYTVTLTVTDTSGNTGTCTTTVRVETVAPIPTVTAGVCEGGPVQFSANPPAPGTGYTYLWNGPASFVSMNPNPIIPMTSSANEGTYVVTVTGPTGCTASGSVLLDLTNLPTQPVLTVPPLICSGTVLTLQCQTFGGTTVSYSWFAGTPANATLLGTTPIPMFQMANLFPGVYQFHVKVTSDGCVSLPSEVKEVTVQARPVATVVNPTISVCTCEPISLGTNVQGPGITYSWTGPGSFVSSAQFPLVTSCAQAFHAGTYTLIVSANGCSSLPVTVNVEVRPKPPKPQISGDATACAGDTIQLTCTDIPTAGQYQWISPPPNLVATNTSINTLIIPNASPTMHSGGWRLQVMQNNCTSDLSDPFNVQVQNFPNISATSNSPVCQGATLTLSANSTMQDVTFVWSGPDNFDAIGANAATNMPATGNYVVTVSTANGCTNVATVPVLVISPPEITSVTHTAPACVDCATDALLQATIFTQNGPLTYSWTGPNMFHSSLPQPVIPKVCTSDNGTYNLVVTDMSGCVSNPNSTTINVQRQPDRPLLGPNQGLCVGSTLTISVQNVNAYGSNVQFEWHTPNGIITQAQANLIITNAGQQHSGDYWLVAKAAGCSSAPSETVTVTVHPIPPAPVPSSNSPVCAGDTLRLFASAVPGGTYAWTGPSFVAGVQNPFIPQANAATHQGCYTATVSVNGCVSPQSNPVCVEIRARPPAPAILPIAPACLSQAGSSLELGISPATATPGAQYIWYNALTQAPLGPPSFALNFTLSPLTGLQSGPNGFVVYALLNGCLSAASAPAQAQLDTVPSGVTAFAGDDFFACDATPFNLSASIPSAGAGLWSLVGGPAVTIVNQPAPTSLVVGATAGNAYRFEWALSNGSCKNFSRDTVRVTVNAFEEARVVNDLKVTCFSDTVQLNAIQGMSSSGFWKQPPGQALFQPPITFDNSAAPNTVVRNLPANANTFFFYWILKVPGCPADTASVTVHTIGKQPFAGLDQTLCITDSCTLLQATSLDAFETGKWFYLDSLQNPGLVINSRNTSATIVCDLQFGANRFLWETNGGLCGDRSRDTVVVYYDLEPTAYEDSVSVSFGTQVTANVLLNDIVPPQFTLRVLDPPKHGLWSETSVGVFSYLPDLTFDGRDQLIYELCNLNPACACSMATLYFDVQEAGECRVPTLITPNSDGINDMFVIPFYCLAGGEGNLENEVTIFNEFGDQVFYAKPYNNDWEGTYNGQPLPVGTYFWVVKLPAEDKPRKGFLVIQR